MKSVKSAGDRFLAVVAYLIVILAVMSTTVMWNYLKGAFIPIGTYRYLLLGIGVFLFLITNSYNFKDLSFIVLTVCYLLVFIFFSQANPFKYGRAFNRLRLLPAKAGTAAAGQLRQHRLDRGGCLPLLLRLWQHPRPEARRREYGLLLGQQPSLHDQLLLSLLPPALAGPNVSGPPCDQKHRDLHRPATPFSF